MKRMLGVFLLVLGIMLSWNTVIADDFFMVPVKGQFTSWDKKIPGSTRFKLVLDGEAVLDRETGLVWEKSLCLSRVSDDCKRSWYQARFYCLNLEKGGRKGWRLPEIEELTSLVDTSQSDPALPQDDPFINVRSSYYWSGTTAEDSGYAYLLALNDGNVVQTKKSYDLYYVWCVRGGYGHDGY